jgi:hypothetical protein
MQAKQIDWHRFYLSQRHIDDQEVLVFRNGQRVEVLLVPKRKKVSLIWSVLAVCLMFWFLVR